MNDLEKLVKIAETIARLNLIEGYELDQNDYPKLWECLSLAREIFPEK